MPEASTRVNALRTGEVNFTHFPVLSQVDSLERAGIQVVRVPQPGFSWSFPMNVQRPPTDDVRVRRAIIHALNRDQIVRSVLFNQFKVAHGPLTAVTFGYDASRAILSDVSLKFPRGKVSAILGGLGGALRGGGVKSSDTLDLQVDLETLTISHDEGFPYQLDGDYLGETKRLEFRHVPDAVRLVRPLSPISQ